jgi:hypothetical protein
MHCHISAPVILLCTLNLLGMQCVSTVLRTPDLPGWLAMCTAVPCEALLRGPVGQRFLNADIDSVQIQYPNIGNISLPVSDSLFLAKDGPNAYLGVCYSPASPSSPGVHDPPKPVADALRMGDRYCAKTCPDCSTKGCAACPLCPLHFDKMDRSSTMFAFWQKAKTPLNRCAFWVMGDEALPLAGGFSAILHAGNTLHGVVAPACEADKQLWLGCAVVQR